MTKDDDDTIQIICSSQMADGEVVVPLTITAKRYGAGEDGKIYTDKGTLVPQGGGDYICAPSRPWPWPEPPESPWAFSHPWTDASAFRVQTLFPVQGEDRTFVARINPDSPSAGSLHWEEPKD